VLDVLEFRSNDTTHRPVLDALQLITRHASAGNLHYYLAGEDIPVPPRPGRGPPYPASAQRSPFLTGNLTSTDRNPLRRRWVLNDHDQVAHGNGGRATSRADAKSERMQFHLNR